MRIAGAHGGCMGLWQSMGFSKGNNHSDYSAVTTDYQVLGPSIGYSVGGYRVV